MSFSLDMAEWGGHVGGLEKALTLLRELPIEQAIAKIEEATKVGFDKFAYGPCDESEDDPEDYEFSDDSEDPEQPQS